MRPTTNTAGVTRIGKDHECKPPWAPDDIAGLLWCFEYRVGSIPRRRLSGRVKRGEECYECGCLRRAQILSVGRHVTATLDHLTNELVLRKVYGDAVERRATPASNAFERMAVAALLRLENERAPAFESRTSLQISRRNRLTTPRVHHRTPWRVLTQFCKGAKRDRSQQYREH